MFQILQDAQPLFIPEGEIMCENVKVAGTIYPRTIFLPEVCNFPVGMRWPVDIGFNDFKSSIQGTLGMAGQVFQQMLLGMEPILRE